MINGKYIVLGVAMGWGYRKGLDVFDALSKKLDDDYQIVLVGVTEKDKEKISPRIQTINRTNNQKELSELYSAADVFVNPTREDNFPTTNIEAIACGLPVISSTVGGSVEMLDNKCGLGINTENVDELSKEIELICKGKKYTREACVRRARLFDMNDRFNEYVDLYDLISK